MNGLLLDTHVLLWWLLTPDLLRGAVRSELAGSAERVVVSAASVWEATIKHAAGKLSIPDDLADAVPTIGFEPLSISLAHGQRAGRLPRHHGDPFDRMLVAQAQHERLSLVTADRRLHAYDVDILAA